MKKEDVEKAFANPGFINNNYYHIEDIKDDKIILTAAITETAKNPYNIPHGGFIFGLGDTAMGLATRTTGKQAVTLNSNITFLRPAQGNVLKAKAYIVKNGKTTAYTKADIYDSEDRLIASMDANYYYIDEERR